MGEWNYRIHDSSGAKYVGGEEAGGDEGRKERRDGEERKEEEGQEKSLILEYRVFTIKDEQKGCVFLRDQKGQELLRILPFPLPALV